ncbi:MAG: DUF1810 domain-containing protein, partial [Gammaproteobacteria bacterium]|nr:DUF1810 domain-containing protein [Gammaproteobacteria bacterium]
MNVEETSFGLARFVAAQDRMVRTESGQQSEFETALAEVRAGAKRSHWMWYIFPQLRGLGRSSTAQHYGLEGAAEAKAYLSHEVLGPRLVTICEAACSLGDVSARSVFGSPDDMKLRSCATLFAKLSEPGSV